MLAYQDFVEGVRAKAELPSTEDARHTAADVMTAVVQHLDGVDREQLATALPGKLRDEVAWDAPNRDGSSAGDIAQEVGGRTGATPERARYLAQAVLSELAEQDPTVAGTLRHRLPDEVGALFQAPGGGPPPERGAAGADDRPRPVDPAELDRALAGLTGWSGGTDGISREVQLPADRHEPLLNQVKAAEAELSHHASIDERDTGVVFTLRTRSLESVTELDLRLARRIDEAVAAVGSGGRPG